MLPHTSRLSGQIRVEEFNTTRLSRFSKLTNLDPQISVPSAR
jgi:hypothetical protein